MVEPDSIQWGINDEPQNIRSKEHRQFLIDTYNKDKCPEHQVKTMRQLIKKLKQEKKK